MTKNDERVAKLIKEVNKRKESISKTERAKWLTNGSFRYSEHYADGSFNLQVVQDENVLVKALAFLLTWMGNYEEAASRLNVDCEEVKWMGFTVEEWQTDFETRLAKIRLTAEKKKLAALEAQLNSLMSDELKTDLQLQEIEALLGD